MNIGEKIQELRKINGYSQSELSKLIGVSRSAIAGYENGYTVPSLEVLCKICEAFKISINSLMDYNPDVPDIKFTINPFDDFDKPKPKSSMNVEYQLNMIQKNILESDIIEFGDNVLTNNERDIALKVIRSTIDLLDDLYSKG